MNSVIKGASYVLVHTPDMVLYNGTTQTTERVVNPDSEYLKAVPEHLRSMKRQCLTGRIRLISVMHIRMNLPK